MSTRALLAREVTPGHYVGRYHHHDGEPSWLGKALWQLYHGKHGARFAGNLEQMQAVLLDHHTAGWLSIIGRWSFPARYVARSRPQCLCHGRFREQARTLTERTAVRAGCEFGYVLTRDHDHRPVMRILSFASPWESTMDWRVVRRIPIPDPVVVATVPLEGSEPDWNVLSDRADSARQRLNGDR